MSDAKPMTKEELAQARAVARVGGRTYDMGMGDWIRLVGRLLEHVESQDAALSRARAEALEEAQEAVGERFRELDALKGRPEQWRSGMLDMHAAAAGALHALIATPAPATIPVERVRGVLLALIDGKVPDRVPGADVNGYMSGWADVLSIVAMRLGVDLDAEGEARRMPDDALDNFRESES